jgi:hypothetical protein
MDPAIATFFRRCREDVKVYGPEASNILERVFQAVSSSEPELAKGCDVEGIFNRAFDSLCLDLDVLSRSQLMATIAWFWCRCVEKPLYGVSPGTSDRQFWPSLVQVM